jgi:hypothetical protein
VLEIVGRNLALPLLKQLIGPIDRIFEAINPHLMRIMSRWMDGAEEVMSHVEWLILMVYMLGWNKPFAFVESFLGISCAYNYKNDQIREISYAIEGYMLLATFAFKGAKALSSAFHSK